MIEKIDDLEDSVDESKHLSSPSPANTDNGDKKSGLRSPSKLKAKTDVEMLYRKT